jgi:hypothetical protein
LIITELHTKLDDLLRLFPALDAHRHLHPRPGNFSCVLYWPNSSIRRRNYGTPQVLVELEMSWRPPFAIPRSQLCWFHCGEWGRNQPKSWFPPRVGAPSIVPARHVGSGTRWRRKGGRSPSRQLRPLVGLASGAWRQRVDGARSIRERRIQEQNQSPTNHSGSSTRREASPTAGLPSMIATARPGASI